jgi:hypothetical protein
MKDNNNTIIAKIGRFFRMLGWAIVGAFREHPVIAAFIAVTMISFLVFIHY